MSSSRKMRRAAAKRAEPRKGLDSLSDRDLRALSMLCAKWQTEAPGDGQRILGAVIDECDSRLFARKVLG